MSDAIALSHNVALMRFGKVYEIWVCPAWGVDFARSGQPLRDYGKALAKARRIARDRFGQTLDIDKPEEPA